MAYSHHGWFQYTNMMSLNKELEEKAHNQRLCPRVSQLQRTTGTPAPLFSPGSHICEDGTICHLTMDLLFLT